jgi:putative nucleotidyltransferase with HDIG domain
MALRVKLLVGLVLLLAIFAVLAGAKFPSKHWLLFLFYLVALLLSSGMKVSLLRNDSTMSVNFPFILLALLQLSPLQAMALAAISVFAQCRFRVQKLFSLVQVGFNVANAVNATAACWLSYVLLRQLHLNTSPALAMGAMAYFFVTTIPVAIVVAWTSGRKSLDLWRENFAWFLPFYLVGAALSALALFLGIHYGLLTGLLLVPIAYTIYRAYEGQIARIRESEQHMADMEALHMRTIESLAMAIEAKDQDTHDHLLRVRVYVTEIGKMLQLTNDEMQALKTAAFLHDIGKLAVPERIINKPGKLTPEEFEKMKIHPVVGADILARVRFPYPVVPIVRAHHEWWNGTGYPDGLGGEAIPIGARILTVVDCFDALASERPYRRPMPLSEAMAMVKKLAGTQFDPRVVEVLEQHFVKIEEQARHEGEKLARLETEMVISRGLAPGAGFEQDSATVKAHGESSASEPTLCVKRRAIEPIHSAQLFSSVADKMQTLLRKIQVSGSTLTLDETLALLRSRLATEIPFRCLLLYLKEGGQLIAQGTGISGSVFFSSIPIPLGEGISGWVAKHEHSIVNGNAAVEPNYRHQSSQEHDLRSALSLPLRDLEGNVFGVLSLYAVGANSFSRDHLRALEAVETTITLALQNSGRVEHTIQDTEPGESLLPTLDARIRDCRAHGGQITLLVCDLGTVGGSAASELFVHRLGVGASLLPWGVLWVVILPGAGEQEVAEGPALARELVAELGCNAEFTSGVGAASFPKDGETAEALLASAERRMYSDKHQPQTLAPSLGIA